MTSLERHRTPVGWAPETWRLREVEQQPMYADAAAHDAAIARIRKLPPLVSVGEIESLKGQLADAAEGHRFVLQGGDCTERFRDCAGLAVVSKLKILLQMSLVLTYGARRPVIRIGRIAGQFAKPRSQYSEEREGVSLPAYRGDNINDLEWSARARIPDPARLERGYFSAAATLNFVRALLEGGFASLRSPEHWKLDFIPDSGEHAGYREIADRIRDAIDYLESLSATTDNFRRIEFFTSHEGLLLPLEEALTRQRTGDDRHYNLGAHFLWVGERTRHIDGAHVEYFRGIANPIGVKVGGTTTPESLLRLLDILDPSHEPGRLMLITRLGAGAIADTLPPLVRALKAAGRKPVWSCDPMHGNTTVVDGTKTRAFEDIASELKSAFQIHRAEGSHLSGVHFELTGENVTECLGGVQNLSPADLRRSYETGCDPRLNYAQSMEIAFLISNILATERRPSGVHQHLW